MKIEQQRVLRMIESRAAFPDRCFFGPDGCPDPVGSQGLVLEEHPVHLCAAHWNAFHDWSHSNGEHHVHRGNLRSGS